MHEQGLQLPLTVDVILQLHRLSRGKIWDVGQFKEEDGKIIERYPDGRSRARCLVLHLTFGVTFTLCVFERLARSAATISDSESVSIAPGMI